MYAPPLTNKAPVSATGVLFVICKSFVLVILTKPLAPVLVNIIFLFAVVVLILNNPPDLIKLSSAVLFIFIWYEEVIVSVKSPLIIIVRFDLYVSVLWPLINKSLVPVIVSFKLPLIVTYLVELYVSLLLPLTVNTRVPSITSVTLPVTVSNKLFVIVKLLLPAIVIFWFWPIVILYIPVTVSVKLPLTPSVLFAL